MSLPTETHTPPGRTLRLALGPVLFFWSKDDIFRFYTEALQWPLDTIYLGEVVCARRQQVRTADWIALANDLADSGKEVVLSSQALIESETDLRRLRRLIENGRVRIEANDLGAAHLARQHGVPFVVGPYFNIYNTETLALVQELGAYRWVPPVEMERAELAAILEHVRHHGPALETELFAWGKLPLALSARCFTARHYNLNKDDCQFRCLDHPDGLTLATREHQGFLTINGIQTMSHGCEALLPHLEEIGRLGVSAVRISPQWQNTGEIVQAFHQVIHGQETPAAALQRIAPHATGPLVDGYWRGLSGMVPLGENEHACA